MSKIMLGVLLLLTSLSLVAHAHKNNKNNNALPSVSSWQWQLPKHFPKPFIPQDNPMTADKVKLGRYLFYDKRLSINGQTSCGTCHIQALAFTDGKAVSVGTTGQLHLRNSPSLANLVFAPTLNWANPAVTSLEAQLLTPLFGDDPVEMGLTDEHFKKVQQAFAQDPLYPQLFTKAFNRPYTTASDFRLDDIAKAIASFERSIISANSKYDRYLAGKATLSDSEQRGMELFFGEKAECSHCHGSVNFNDQLIYINHKNQPIADIAFHNTGLYNLSSDGDYPDNNQGLFEVTGNPSDKGKFKAPSLRNIALTAPYNHDGSTPTLQAVLQNYANGGRIINTGKDQGDGRYNPHKSDLIAQIDLNAQEQADIIAFLHTLTDDELINNPEYGDPFVTP